MRRTSYALAILTTLTTAFVTAPTASSSAGYFETMESTAGSICRTSGDVADFRACGSVANLLRNQTTDWVRLYPATNFQGAYFCVAQGASHSKGSQPFLRFNKGQGPGYGTTIWGNIQSVRLSGGGVC